MGGQDSIKAAWLAACGGGAAETTTSTTASTSTTTTAQARTITTRASGEIALEFPAQVEAGTEFQATWTGPDSRDDYVTIVEVGAGEGAYLSYFYTREGVTGSVLAPVEPGDYEIRYVDGASETTEATSPIVVTAYEIILEAPAEVQAGTEFQVTWTKSGGDGPDDCITVVPAGAAEGSYEAYFNTSEGATGTLVAPIEAGDFEVRYVNGAEAKTLASVEIVVTPYEITLEAPVEVEAGTEFEVAWTGPDGPGDYITIVPSGSPEGSYTDYEYTSAGSPITLMAPEEPGDYEIRYASDRVAGTFAAFTIAVK
jgi:Ca-activated chloride channel family protein